MNKTLKINILKQFYSAILQEGLSRGGGIELLILILSDLVNQYRFDGSLRGNKLPNSFPKGRNDRTFSAIAFQKELLAELVIYLNEIPKSTEHLYKEFLIKNEFILEGQEVLLSIFDGNFEELVDELITEYLSSKMLISGVPKPETTELLLKLAEISQPGIDIYNPFANLGTFGVNKSITSHYYADEINPDNWALSTLRLLAYNQASSHLILNDSINRWNSFKKKYDLIISRPPLGRRLSANVLRGLKYGNSTESFVVEKSLSSLKEDGRAVFLLSSGFLNGADEAHLALRKHLVDNDLVEMIVELPKNALTHSSLYTAIFVLNNNKPESAKGKTVLIDAKDFNLGEGRNQTINSEAILEIINGGHSPNRSEASIEKLRELDYNLTLGYYQNSFISGVVLSNLLEPITLHRSGLIQGEETLGHGIRIRHLSQNPFQGKLKFGNKFLKVEGQFKILDRDALLVARLFENLRPSYIMNEPEGSNFYIDSNVMAFELDTTVASYDYLVAELNKSYVKEQVKRLSDGATIKHLTKKNFLSIKIDLVSLDKQSREVEKFRLEYEAELIKFKDSDKKSEELKTELHEQNTHLRHTLTGPTSNISGATENIISILKNLDSKAYPNLLEQKVSKKHKYNLAYYLSILERDTQKVKDVVARQLNVSKDDISDKPREDVDLRAFLAEYIKVKEATVGDRFRIVNQDQDSTFMLSAIAEGVDGSFLDHSKQEAASILIEGNKDLLTQMMDNLIENAEIHAFDENTNGRVEIWLGYDKEFNELTLLVSNNGKTMPKDFDFSDFIKRGVRKGKNNGDGYGGYLINEVAKFHNAEIDIIDEHGPEGLGISDLATSFEFIFQVKAIETE
ncbi:MAG: hypothetical protein COA58_03345 [Bacteroidetes bacterium]|nr:MAG: hypothetical protein COA58_03345 [Bacteroidota bacterium]